MNAKLVKLIVAVSIFSFSAQAIAECGKLEKASTGQYKYTFETVGAEATVNIAGTNGDNSDVTSMFKGLISGDDYTVVRADASTRQTDGFYSTRFQLFGLELDANQNASLVGDFVGFEFKPSENGAPAIFAAYAEDSNNGTQGWNVTLVTADGTVLRQDCFVDELPPSAKITADEQVNNEGVTVYPSAVQVLQLFGQLAAENVNLKSQLANANNQINVLLAQITKLQNEIQQLKDIIANGSGTNVATKIITPRAQIRAGIRRLKKERTSENTRKMRKAIRKLRQLRKELLGGSRKNGGVDSVSVVL